MPTAKLHALTILGALDEARSELVGKAVVLTDGKAGTVENVWLDELHGLRISIRGHDGKWPVSTINSRRPAETAKAERLSRTECCGRYLERYPNPCRRGNALARKCEQLLTSALGI